MYRKTQLLPRLVNYRLEIIQGSYHVVNNVTEVSEYENKMLPQAFSVLYQLEAGLDAMIDQASSGVLQADILADLIEGEEITDEEIEMAEAQLAEMQSALEKKQRLN